jgi:predicted nucleotidyltransferase
MSKHPVIDIIVKKSPHLGWMADRTVLLVRHGSNAYGTNTASSDEDFKGVAIPTKEYFFGSKRFEQAELKAPDPDAVIYDIRKFFSLAADCNPNPLKLLKSLMLKALDTVVFELRLEAAGVLGLVMTWILMIKSLILMR